jgi:hypothetical protein
MKKWEDPIVAEIHAERRALVEKCGNNAQAVFNYFLESKKKELHRVSSMSPILQSLLNIIVQEQITKFR